MTALLQNCLHAWRSCTLAGRTCDHCSLRCKFVSFWLGHRKKVFDPAGYTRSPLAWLCPLPNGARDGRGMAALLRTLTATPAGRRLLLPALPATCAAAALTAQESNEAPRQPQPGSPMAVELAPLACDPALRPGTAPPPEAEHARDALHAVLALLRRLAEGGPRHAPPEAVGDYAAAACDLLRCPACAPAQAMAAAVSCA